MGFFFEVAMNLSWQRHCFNTFFHGCVRGEIVPTTTDPRVTCHLASSRTTLGLCAVDVAGQNSTEIGHFSTVGRGGRDQ